jgi:hypothetical protein
MGSLTPLVNAFSSTPPSGQGTGVAGEPAGGGVSKKMEERRVADSEDAQGLLAQAGAVAGEAGIDGIACC